MDSILAIQKNLSAMFQNPEHREMWLTYYHPELKAVPIEKMTESIEGLLLIRDYLDHVVDRGC